MIRLGCLSGGFSYHTKSHSTQNFTHAEVANLRVLQDNTNFAITQKNWPSFCSTRTTSLPLASARWVQSIFSSLCLLSSNQRQTRGCWVRRKNASYAGPPHPKKIDNHMQSPETLVNSTKGTFPKIQKTRSNLFSWLWKLWGDLVKQDFWFTIAACW